jgi:hypothetical protein
MSVPHSMGGPAVSTVGVSGILTDAGHPALDAKIARGAHGTVWSLIGGKQAVKISSDIYEAGKIKLIAGSPVDKAMPVLSAEQIEFAITCCVLPRRVPSGEYMLLVMPLYDAIVGVFFEETLTDTEFAYYIAMPLAAALAWLHSKRIAHLDVKPGNVVFDPGTMFAKLCDFGNSAMLKGGQTEQINDFLHRAKMSGIGTAGYYKQDGVLDLQADVTALTKTLEKIRPKGHSQFEALSTKDALCWYTALAEAACRHCRPGRTCALCIVRSVADLHDLYTTTAHPESEPTQSVGWYPTSPSTFADN